MDVFEFIISIVGMVFFFITIWVLLLRKSRRREHIAPQGKYELSELATIAESLQERIDILESILDAEVPDWREQNVSNASQESGD